MCTSLAEHAPCMLHSLTHTQLPANMAAADLKA